jgi:histidine triad (HIT) family protein
LYIVSLFFFSEKHLKLIQNFNQLNMSDDCIFCKIVAGEAPASVEYEDDLVVAFNDINPKAPVHILIVPKMHIDTVSEMEEQDQILFGHMVWVARQLAEQRHLAGYKLVLNVGKLGGQVVFHVHMHLVGGWEERAPVV